MILDLAAIRESELNPLTQCLYPVQDHKIDNLMLLEVDKHILEELDKGDTYVYLQIIMIVIQVSLKKFKIFSYTLIIRFSFYSVK